MVRQFLKLTKLLKTHNDERILYFIELSHKFTFFYIKPFTILYVFYIYEALRHNVIQICVPYNLRCNW